MLDIVELSNPEFSAVRDPNAKPSPVHRSLREATHELHVRLNRHGLLAGLTKPGYPPAFYGKVLTAYYHCYQAFEQAIDEYIEAHRPRFDYQGRHKFPWLMKDVAALRMSPDSTLCLPLNPVGPPVIASTGHYVGLLYALEGATQGGQVISRHLGSHLGLTPETGMAFFYGYGPEGDARWAEFLAFAEGIGAMPAEVTQAQAMARETFLTIETALDDYASRG